MSKSNASGGITFTMPSAPFQGNQAFDIRRVETTQASSSAVSSSSSSSRDARLKTVPKKVHGRLSKNSPYIGFFHHAPSAGNRSRQTYFEKDIISNEAIRKQREVRCNPMIGNFHYGHDLYGKKMEDFQRILAQLRVKDEERQVQAILDRQAWPFGGDLSQQGVAGGSAHHHRGRALSIPNSAGLKLLSRSVSATEATPLRSSGTQVVMPVQVMPVPTKDNASVEASGVKYGGVLKGKASKRRAYGGAPRVSRGGGITNGNIRAVVGNGVALGGKGLRRGRHGNKGDRGGRGGTVKEGGGVLRPAFGGDGDRVESGSGSVERHVDVADYLDGEERRRLKARAFAIVVYGSGDSLVKLAEKERRKCASTKRFKYAGAIDVSKSYPLSGSLDDCALLRSEVAERSRLYNDLIAEVNGFRRHFFFRQKMHPKEAYLHARRQRQQEAESAMAQNVPNVDVYSDDDAESCVSWSRQKSDSSMAGDGLSGGSNGMNGAMASGGMGADGSFDNGWSGARLVAGDDGVPPFHTLVGPGQFPRQDRPDQAQPGDAWMPGTVSALRTKKSWRVKQAMRDCHKFKPFFVQAKTDFTATYRLMDDCILGEGSYATVYIAEHLERGEVVAVKAVQKRLLFSDMEKRSLGREIDNQLRMLHKHVVRLYEVYETPDQVYIVLENCDCGDLEKMLYLRGRLTEIEAKRVTMQLLEALHYLHGKGIVHCDIKPQNLLFAPDPETSQDGKGNGNGKGVEGEESTKKTGKSKGLIDHGKKQQQQQQQLTSPAGKLAKVCDFGISCKVPDARFYKQTGDIHKIPWSGLFGTGGYIAPEIMSQQPFGKPADLWSVGVVLYQMISGRLPFIPARACVSKPVSYPAAVWTDVNTGVKDLICGLLEKDPSQRLTAAQALHHPWIQTIQHLHPFFPHFVPKQCRYSSAESSRSMSRSSSSTNGTGE